MEATSKMTEDSKSAAVATTDLPPWLRRLRAFVISNGTSSLAIVPALLLASSRSKHPIKWWAACVFRLGFVCSVLGFFASRKRARDGENKEDEKRRPSEPSTLEMILRMVFIASPLETLMTAVALERFTMQTGSKWWKFVPLTFLFEVLVDFGHYTAHRFVHMNAFLYRWSGHKTHHAIHKPTVLATFNQDFLDVVLSNVVPVLGSLWLMDKVGLRFSKEQLLLAMGLKTYVEVAGHVGILDSHASSFPQFVWLPRWLGIELQTRDHDLHHTHGGKHNFAKRFTLFDKLFGTYRTVEDF